MDSKLFAQQQDLGLIIGGVGTWGGGQGNSIWAITSSQILADHLTLFQPKRGEERLCPTHYYSPRRIIQGGLQNGTTYYLKQFDHWKSSHFQGTEMGTRIIQRGLQNGALTKQFDAWKSSHLSGKNGYPDMDQNSYFLTNFRFCRILSSYTNLRILEALF